MQVKYTGIDKKVTIEVDIVSFSNMLNEQKEFIEKQFTKDNTLADVINKFPFAGTILALGSALLPEVEKNNNANYTLESKYKR